MIHRASNAASEEQHVTFHVSVRRDTSGRWVAHVLELPEERYSSATLADLVPTVQAGISAYRRGPLRRFGATLRPRQVLFELTTDSASG